MTTEASFLPKPQNKTDRLTPVSRFQPNAQSTRPHHKHHYNLVGIACCQSRHRQNLTSMFSASHEGRAQAVKRDGHWLLYQQ
jgi:hypothetical protein